jgi:hypothetical protein
MDEKLKKPIEPALNILWAIKNHIGVSIRELEENE